MSIDFQLKASIGNRLILKCLNSTSSKKFIFLNFWKASCQIMSPIQLIWFASTLTKVTVYQLFNNMALQMAKLYSRQAGAELRKATQPAYLPWQSNYPCCLILKPRTYMQWWNHLTGLWWAFFHEQNWRHLHFKYFSGYLPLTTKLSLSQLNLLEVILIHYKTILLNLIWTISILA